MNDWFVEEDHFGSNAKRNKQERKQLKAKDRSKYKKTDLNKWLLQKKTDEERSLSEKDLLRGRVLSINSQEINVIVEEKTYTCQLRGLLKKEKSQEKNLVIVGDFVLFEVTDEKHGIIAAVEERRSILARADNLSRRKQQLIAANIDQVFITFSVTKPTLKPFLADRYIIAADKGGMKPILLINKIDLLQDPDTTDAEKQMYEDFRKSYLAANIPVLSVSTVTNEGMEELKNYLKDKASVFSGQSGVGKSSLINAITGLHLKIGAPVEKTGKGSHTTTIAQLIPLSSGGFCIDTPGIKSFGIWELKREELEAYFEDIHAIGSECHFPDCQHIHENKCAVKQAVETGALPLLRYESYIQLIQSIEENYLRR